MLVVLWYDIREKELVKGPWSQRNLDCEAEMLIPVDDAECGVIIGKLHILCLVLVRYIFFTLILRYMILQVIRLSKYYAIFYYITFNVIS